MVRGASRLAIAAGITPLVVGLTVVAFGTSAPELAVTVGAAYAGQAEVALGNVVGSNIFNRGALARLDPPRVDRRPWRADMILTERTLGTSWPLRSALPGRVRSPISMRRRSALRRSTVIGQYSPVCPPTTRRRTVRKITYWVLIGVVVFMILQDPSDTGNLFQTFFDLLGDGFGAFFEFLDSMLDGSSESSEATAVGATNGVAILPVG